MQGGGFHYYYYFVCLSPFISVSISISVCLSLSLLVGQWFASVHLWPLLPLGHPCLQLQLLPASGTVPHFAPSVEGWLKLSTVASLRVLQQL